MFFLKLILFAFGILINFAAMRSAVRTLVLSRGERDMITGVVFASLRRAFEARLRWTVSYYDRDRVMAFYAPVALLALPPTWLAMVLIGFMAMYWSTGVESWQEAFTISGSSLLTLGFARGSTIVHTTLSFIEATLGLIFVALLIAYLPTMYNAFSRRESEVTKLEVRAGIPPSASEMLLRFHRNHGLDRLHETWRVWETWFAEVQESHTSLAALVFFRSQQPDHSWVTAAGTILDSAALTLSALEIPWDAQAALCIRAGYLALRRIADFFEFDYPENPQFPSSQISISQGEFNEVYDQLADASVPLKNDRDQAWRDFAGWRVNYDQILLDLCRLTMAPKAPWSSDRVSS